MLLTAPLAPSTGVDGVPKYHSSGAIPLLPSVASLNEIWWIRPHSQEAGLPRSRRSHEPALSRAMAVTSAADAP